MAVKLPQLVSGGISSAARKLAPREPARIDIDSLSRELDLEKEGWMLAVQNLPAADQTVLTMPEAKVVQRIEKSRREAVAWASGRLDSINEALSSRDVTVLVNHALSVERTFERNAMSRLSEHELLVKELANHAAIRNRELEQFKQRHGITRPATYPEGSAVFARYALLLALIVVEGIANAYFFSRGLESGLIGGFIAAGLFAAVNLLVAFVVGKFGVPYVCHSQIVLKLFGIAAALFGVVWVISMGLTIAHFRDALVGGIAEPARAAWTAFRAAPFELQDIMSWLLFLISVLFAVFALFDGLSSDDRYPGYGAVARRARQAREEYLDEIAAMRKELEALKDAELAALDEDMRKVHSLTAEYANLLREKRWVRTKLEAALLDAENCMETLLRVFRESNFTHRRDGVRPEYFETRPKLSPLVLPDFGSDDDRATLAEQEKLVGRLSNAVEHARLSIQAAFITQSEKLKPAEGHVRLAVSR